METSEECVGSAVSRRPAMSPRKPVMQSAKCLHCGAVFGRRYKQKGPRYCSVMCRKTAHANRRVDKECGQCGVVFSVAFTRGVTHTMYCSKSCRSKAIRQQRRRATESAGPCSTPGCPRRSSRPAELCEACYVRKRRPGSVKRKTHMRPLNRCEAGGYILVRAREHPLANKDGWVREHRKVLFDAIGDAPHDCVWCGRTLHTWASITVDHFDDNKSNNAPVNLLPSCNACNRARGSMRPFLWRLTVSGAARMVEMVNHRGFPVNEIPNVRARTAVKRSGARKRAMALLKATTGLTQVGLF